MRVALVHCSYHKCLTVYFSRIFRALYGPLSKIKVSKGYKHFNSLLDDFYRNLNNFKIASINNHSLDLGRLGGDFRLTRFIRDPRDLVVSGYFYHKKGGESWCNIVDPVEKDWQIVNGCVPSGMSWGQSFSTYLQNLNKDEGLMAEIDFRAKHFDSMRQWPKSDSRIKLFFYEDILGNEQDVFAEILAHYGLSWPVRQAGIRMADRFSADKQSNAISHIRDPQIGQWQQHFSRNVEAYFEERYADILERYGYA